MRIPWPCIQNTATRSHESVALVTPQKMWVLQITFHINPGIQKNFKACRNGKRTKLTLRPLPASRSERMDFSLTRPKSGSSVSRCDSWRRRKTNNVGDLLWQRCTFYANLLFQKTEKIQNPEMKRAKVLKWNGMCLFGRVFGVDLMWFVDLAFCCCFFGVHWLAL